MLSLPLPYPTVSPTHLSSEAGNLSMLSQHMLYIQIRQVFICRASVVGIDPEELEDCKESKHCDQTETILRVKDPLAAVWPFCGIVVEVCLLHCVFI